jgi:hypothetical protein
LLGADVTFGGPGTMSSLFLANSICWNRSGYRQTLPHAWLSACSGSWHLLQTYTAKVNLSDASITGTLLVRRVGGEENNECIKIKTNRGKKWTKIKAKSYAASEHGQIVFRWHINLVYKWTHSLIALTSTPFLLSSLLLLLFLSLYYLHVLRSSTGGYYSRLITCFIQSSL